MDVFRRKSCVTAMPMEAKARDVRSQARNVRSSARWSRATLPLLSNSTLPYLSAVSRSQPMKPLDGLLLSSEEEEIGAAPFASLLCDCVFLFRLRVMDVLLLFLEALGRSLVPAWSEVGGEPS